MTPGLVAIGVSLGGLAALRALLGALPADFPAAPVIVQHRVMEESGELAMLLGETCLLSVGFPLDKECIQAGRVYIAPPNYHLLVENDHFAFSLDAPENYARPSIDVLFESAAKACGAGVTGIVLTGTGRDGARGLAAIRRRRGGRAIVQSPREATAPEMPLAALAAVPDARQLTLKEMRERLARMAHNERVQKTAPNPTHICGVGFLGNPQQIKYPRAVELTLFTDPAIPAEVLSDAGRLRQVLINLVNNAIKFSSGREREGRVSVRAVLADDCKDAGGRATHGAVAEHSPDQACLELSRKVVIWPKAISSRNPCQRVKFLTGSAHGKPILKVRY